MDTVDIVLKILPLVTGVAGYSINGFLKDKENRKLRKQLQEKDERLKANEMYEKIRNKREVFEDSMTDLLCIGEEANINERQRLFIRVSQKYTALYNEIEDFCTKLFDDVINSQAYIKDTILPILSGLAEKQVEYYKSLNDYAIKYSFDKIRRPDYKAFEKYDKFLIEYNGGEGSHFWRKIKNMRRDGQFE